MSSIIEDNHSFICMAHKNERGHENEDVKGKTQVLVAGNWAIKKGM